MTETLVPLSMIRQETTRLDEVPIGEEVGVNSRLVKVVGKAGEYKMYLFTDTPVIGKFDAGPASVSQGNAASRLGKILIRSVEDDIIGVTRLTDRSVSIRVPAGVTFQAQEELAGGATEGHHLVYVEKIKSFTRPQECPDGGKCNHKCEDRCWRVDNAGPLSGVFPNDDWPAEVKRVR